LVYSIFGLERQNKMRNNHKMLAACEILPLFAVNYFRFLGCGDQIAIMSATVKSVKHAGNLIIALGNCYKIRLDITGSCKVDSIVQGVFSFRATPFQNT